MTNATRPAGPAPIDTISADFCVVGGGMAGVCAAIAAARHGLKVVLLQDRAVLGGNASSEVRMWICGAHGRDAKETGIIEEILLLNLHQNYQLNYPLWDAVLYGAVAHHPNIELILSCAVTEVEMAGPERIRSVRAWHLTRQRWIRVEARQFADCSGDSILRLSGAQVRWGREARHEFNECHAPEVADRKTMGNSILLQMREIDPADHVPYRAPPWAHQFPLDHHRLSARGVGNDNFWWLEIGGVQDTQNDADRIRDELYKMALGAWAWIKNHPDGRGKKWELEWVGALPGKRENVRYIGDHTMTQTDVETRGQFNDIVCHGGWSMDDHPPAAFQHQGAPTVFHPAPSPFGIPWRSLYSANIANLYCAGRNISCTHMAMSATRVMATCATMGQAIGTGAAIAHRHGLTPREVGQQRLIELQSILLDDDQFIPGKARPIPELTRAATLTTSRGDGEALRNGIDRRLGESDNWWRAAPGDWAELRFDAPRAPGRVRIVCDTELHKPRVLPCSIPLKRKTGGMPSGTPRDFHIEAQGVDGTWRTIHTVSDNHRRLVVLPVDGIHTALRLVLDRTWGDAEAAFFAFDAGAPVLAAPLPEAPWTSKAVTRTSAA
ncbi:MAG: FAD-dependent oxidoreductase [Planctomycetes bacterium]|nr:FAD-dependent oxidoreductase [Planctomycetota bacterium]